jgi:hypothetical protein
MRDLQSQVLERNIERLSEVLTRAERRCARYNDESAARRLDLAFVEHIAVCLHQLRKFQRENLIRLNRDDIMPSLKDAITQLHELCAYVNEEIVCLEGFQQKIFLKEERWVRMLNISLVSLFVNICADNIRFGLEEIERHVGKMNKQVDHAQSKQKKSHLRIVK